MKRNRIEYYGQYGEDFLLQRFFDCQKTGFFVEVGAFDGVFLSNTLLFEQHGWSGICIEPHPEYFHLCQKARRNSLCLNAACVSEDKESLVPFFVEELGLFSGMLGDREADVRSRYEKHGLSFQGFNRINVPALTLNSILARNLSPGTPIDFISIDVEGTELDVLRGLDLSRFRPRVLVIEANTSAAREALDAYLKDFGYVNSGWLKINSFYVTDLNDAKKLQAITVDHKIEKVLHPLVEEFSLETDLGKGIRGRRLVQEDDATGSISAVRRIGKKLRNIFKNL